MPIQTTHARHYFTYLALTETLEIWDISGRIADKYPTWQLRLALPKVITHRISYPQSGCSLSVTLCSTIYLKTSHGFCRISKTIE